MKKFIYSILPLCTISCATPIQKISLSKGIGYWQQRVDYTMDIDMDVTTCRYKGKQQLVYTNNSPEELDKVFYHLYFNAFQPNSQMDARLHAIQDPDGRMVNRIETSEESKVESRIAKLQSDEIGYIKVNSLKQNGKEVLFEITGTILEVTLNTPVKPGGRAVFDMNFHAQVPLQIRRSGRNNKEGIALSMSQWYPKIAEYDYEGWHTSPYIAREFHGVWGDFDVTLHIDKNYVVGGTGNLLNPQEVGHGYEDKSKPLKLLKGNKLTWKFAGKEIHDFTWAADPEYQHDVYPMENGIYLHFLYKKTLEAEYLENWKKLQPETAELMTYFSENIGPYPYKQYSVIQAGDGGMEYAQCTLITGERSRESLFGVTAHELAHTWFQFLLATNESKHPWMDEGFATYIANKASNDILNKRATSPDRRSYERYFALVKRGLEKPLSTHADRYETNAAYGIGSYSKGSIFLSQLEYIIGSENVAKTLKKYYTDFAFKHPNPNDFKRTAEKISGIHLDWYLNEWTQTTHTIDYGVKHVKDKEITLQRIGAMPMPIDVEVEYRDGTKESFNIPLEIMRGNKNTTATLLKDWGWAYPTYTFNASKSVKSVTIDKNELMADINPLNNTFTTE